jgi:hypothetical protein
VRVPGHPNDGDPRIDAEGRASRSGWVELIKEPADEVATRMTAKVIGSRAGPRGSRPMEFVIQIAPGKGGGPTRYPVVAASGRA